VARRVVVVERMASLFIGVIISQVERFED